MNRVELFALGLGLSDSSLVALFIGMVPRECFVQF